MDFNYIKNKLCENGHNSTNVDAYVGYLVKLEKAKNKVTKAPENPWISWKKDTYYIHLFEKVAGEGLVFDGKHVTLSKRGLSYDYIAYKTKFLKAYPAAKIDIGLVFKGDTFKSKTVDGKVHYIYEPIDEFNQVNVIGGYCVIKCSRGEFVTRMSETEFVKHMSIAATTSIWKKWPKEMRFKTIAKKAFKFHFEDEFKGMNEEDNKNVDLSKIEDPFPKEEEIPQDQKELLIKGLKLKIPKCETKKELHELYQLNMQVFKDSVVLQELAKVRQAQIKSKEL